MNENFVKVSANYTLYLYLDKYKFNFINFDKVNKKFMSKKEENITSFKK